MKSFNRFGKHLLLLALALPMTGYAVCGGNGTWSGNAGNMLWSDVGNWSGCVPTGITDGATFPPVGATQTVHVDNLAVTLGLPGATIIFNSSTTHYTIAGGHTLTLTGAAPTIFVTGNQTFGDGLSSLFALLETMNTSLTISGSGTLNFLDAGLTDMGISNITINGPSITVTNNLPVVGAIPGSLVTPNGNLMMTGGTLTVVNTGTVSNAVTSVAGSQFAALGNVSLTNVTISATNSGTIGTGVVTQNWGSLIGTPVNGSTLTLTGCNTTLTNNGAINIGQGVLLESGSLGGTFTMNGGTLMAINNSNLSGSGLLSDTVTGVAIFAGNVLAGPSDFILNGGTIELINHGNISGANVTGNVGAILFANNLVMNGGGSIYIFNDGVVTQPAPGIIDDVGSLVFTVSSINISNGLLVNDDLVSTPALNIQPAGILSGSGNPAAASGAFVGFPKISTAIQITNSGGTVLPGDPGLGGVPAAGVTPGGTMSIIGGNYTQTSGKFVANILNASNFSQLVISNTTPPSGVGKAILAGDIELAVTPGFTLNPTDTFQLIQAAGGLSGEFNPPINFNIPPGFDPILAYFPNFVLLSFNTSLTNTVPSFPGNFSGVVTSSVSQLNQLNLMDRLRTFACTPTEIYEETPTEKTREFNECQPSKCASHPWSIYFGPLGIVSGKSNDKGHQVGFEYSSAGALMGFDYVSTNYGIGFMTAYEKTFAHVHRDWGKFDINDIHASLYARYAPSCLPELAFNGIIGGGLEFYQIRRTVYFPRSFIDKTAEGTPHGHEYDALFGTQYTFEDSKWQVIPLASAQYIHVNVENYRERHGGFYNIKFNRQHLESLRSILGVRANYTWGGCDVSITPEITVNWEREFLLKKRSVSFTSAVFDEPSSSLHMPAAGRNFFLGGANLFINIGDKYGVEANYSFEWNSLFHDHFLYIGASFRL